MRKKMFSNWLILILLFGISLLSANRADAVREWALECSENYSECGGANLPEACDEQVFMRSELESSLSPLWTHGWDLREENAWPQDWWEADTVAGGLDTSYMDAIGKADLSFYAGHGTGGTEPNGSWDLHMGHRQNGACQATSPGQIKLGEQSSDGWGNNGDNEYVLLDASCSMVIGEIDQVWQNWGPGILMRSHQGMGYHGSPTDTDDRGEEFIENVDDGDSNRSAWLDAGESCFLFWCWNSPAVITFGQNQADAQDRHNNETMLSPRSDPPSGWGGHYYWSWIDNGGC